MAILKALVLLLNYRKLNINLIKLIFSLIKYFFLFCRIRLAPTLH